MININWQDIRPYQGSQNTAFEELICQLARVEFEGQGRFIRIAAPDGGVEATCLLPDGSLYGWQAKYFVNSFTSTQWSDIEGSLIDSLNNYPNLVKYYVCVPVDRNNAFVEGKKSFLQKWDEHVAKWKNLPEAQGRNLGIEFWGSYELFLMLSKPENAGKLSFWFSQKELSESWFKNQNRKSIATLGKRYTPELNIHLPVAMNFEALARTTWFKQEYSKKFDEILVALLEQLDRIDKLKAFEINTKQVLNLLKDKLNLSMYDDIQVLPVELLLSEIDLAIKNCQETLNDDSISHSTEEHIEKIIDNLYELKTQVNSDEIRLFNGNVLWLNGEAGVGKSHLIADFINGFSKDSLASILLLGQDFIEKSNFEHQIMNRQLELTFDFQHFLSILDTIAETQRQRVILAIDALNEGAGKELWPSQLNSLISQLRDYPRIGLILSVRNTYQSIITKELSKVSRQIITEVTHYGFENHEFEAVQTYFAYYGFPLPTVPLLNSEFSNPLYLGLLCESLKNNGLDELPKGYQGFNQLVFSYVKGIQKKISDELDEDESLRLVERAIEVLVAYEVQNKVSYIDYLLAKRLINEELNQDISEVHAKKFIDYLIKEGVLSKNIFHSDGNESIYFTYERIGDYLQCDLILQGIFCESDFLEWFNTELAQTYLENYHMYRGFWEALSVLLPEKLGIEIFEVLNNTSLNKNQLVSLVVKSIPWRVIATLNPEKIRTFLKSNLGKNHIYQWFNLLFQLSAEPNHPFNATYLTNILFPMSLADRDAHWTTKISQLDDYPPINQLLLWCETYSFDENLDLESIFLAGLMLCWLFTSTNIKERNRSVKALAYILRNRLAIAHRLLSQFIDVNDPYILEGLLSATYGALKHSDNLNDLPELGDFVYEAIFDVQDDKEVYPNILVRKYAKLIVETALFNKPEHFESHLKTIMENITPPYNTSFPEKLPSNQEIDEKYTTSAHKTILRSMTTEYGRGIGGYGDFGRYTFESAFHRWRYYQDSKPIHIVNADLLSNYACELVFDKYGYDAKKHEAFDDTTYRYNNRSENRIERIGKKYQWLAFFEMLARVMDNFQAPIERYGENSPMAWIDNFDEFSLPKVEISLQPRNKTHLFVNETKQIPKLIYTLDWNKSHSDWISDDSDLPQIQSLIEFEIDSEPWLVLQRYVDFNEPRNFGELKNNEKRLWLQIRSYFIPSKGINKSLEWLKSQNFSGRWMPESSERYETNLTKFFEAEVENLSWETVQPGRGRGQTDDIKLDVLPSVDTHIWESTYGNDSCHLFAPCRELYQGLKMSSSLKKGYWLDENHELVSFSPLKENNYADLILIKKSALLKFLKQNNVKIFWTVLGEKQAWQSKWNVFNEVLEISGVYHLNRGNSLIGSLNTQHRVFEK
jgi:hypothetical protein